MALIRPHFASHFPKEPLVTVLRWKMAAAFVTNAFATVWRSVVNAVTKEPQVTNLFVLNFAILGANAVLMPVRESLTLDGGKTLQTRLMMLTVVASIVGQAMFAYYSGKYGGLETLRGCLFVSSICCFATYTCLLLAPALSLVLSSIFYLWFTFYNMTSMSTFWAIAGDVLEDPHHIAQVRPPCTTAGESHARWRALFTLNVNSPTVRQAQAAADSDNASKGKGKKTTAAGSLPAKATDAHTKKIAVFSHLGAGGTLGGLSGSYSASLLIKVRVAERIRRPKGVTHFPPFSLLPLSALSPAAPSPVPGVAPHLAPPRRRLHGLHRAVQPHRTRAGE